MTKFHAEFSKFYQIRSSKICLKMTQLHKSIQCMHDAACHYYNSCTLLLLLFRRKQVRDIVTKETKVTKHWKLMKRPP